MTHRRRAIFAYVCFPFLCVLLCGCMIVASKYEAGEPLREEQLEKIQPGKTTRQEILEMFGPPVAVARKGKVMKIPSPGQRKEGSQEIDSEPFFELFSTTHELTENHIIYYYYYSEETGIGAIVLFTAGAKAKLGVDKLWILVNDETGIVEDYLFREQQ